MDRLSKQEKADLNRTFVMLNNARKSRFVKFYSKIFRNYSFFIRRKFLLKTPKIIKQ